MYLGYGRKPCHYGENSPCHMECAISRQTAPEVKIELGSLELWCSTTASRPTVQHDILLMLLIHFKLDPLSQFCIIQLLLSLQFSKRFVHYPVWIFCLWHRNWILLPLWLAANIKTVGTFTCHLQHYQKLIQTSVQSHLDMNIEISANFSLGLTS